MEVEDIQLLKKGAQHTAGSGLDAHSLKHFLKTPEQQLSVAWISTHTLLAS